MSSEHTLNRRGFIVLSASTAILVLSGCNTVAPSTPVPLATESLGGSTKRELGEKYLHHHSLMQQLMWLGAKDNFRVIFKSGSDDAFVTSSVPDSWAQALVEAKSRDGITVSGDMVGSAGGTRALNITDNSVGAYKKLLRENITPEVLMGDGLSGKYMTKSDRSTKKLFEGANFVKGEYLPLTFIFNKIYGLGVREDTPVFFSYDPKSSIITYSTEPQYFHLTPYKRQLFINFLDSRGIGYITHKNGIAIKDNFTNWIEGVDNLRKINKYRYSVYGVFDGSHFFEVADSNYRDSPITIEFIDWTPDGQREYNIYCKGYHRKIITDKRFHNYYVPDGSKKYFLRFY